MDKTELQLLASRVLNNEATHDECEQLNNWFEAGLLEGEELVFTKEPENVEAVKSRLFNAINDKLAFEPEKNVLRKRKLWPYLSAAAVVLIICGLSFLYFSQYHKLKVEDVYVQEVNPGGNKAILTLSNGQVINLSDANDGKLVEAAGLTVTKTKDGQLIYDLHDAAKEGDEKEAAISYNTISTPRGGQYQLILPDGTRIWLNAASTLKFPTSFASLSSRDVELSGEAYFEVKEDKTKPFRVINTHIEGRNQLIEVLGTHFNVNAYSDERTTKTTLLEGKLRVTQGDLNVEKSKLWTKGLILNPGQQSVLDKTQLTKTELTDVEESIAWKNGYFQFDHVKLEAIMRQISRWYDVTIRYEGAVPQLEFGGQIQRNLTLNQVLKLLNKSEVHFRIEGKEVIVMP